MQQCMPSYRVMTGRHHQLRPTSVTTALAAATCEVPLIHLRISTEERNSLALGNDHLAILHPSIQLLEVELAGDHPNGPRDGQRLCHYLAGAHCHVVPTLKLTGHHSPSLAMPSKHTSIRDTCSLRCHHSVLAYRQTMYSFAESARAVCMP